LVLTRKDVVGTALSSGALITAAVWMFRALARSADRSAIPSLLRKLPINVIAGVAGILLFLCIASLWSLLFHTLIWLGDEPTAARFADERWLFRQTVLLGISALVFGALAFVSGRFSGFLNLSSLHTFYAARLTRAYLGASNGK